MPRKEYYKPNERQNNSFINRKTGPVLIGVLALAALFLVGAATVGMPGDSGLQEQQVYEQTHESVAGVLVVNDNGQQSSGSAWVYDAEKELLVTNQHVVAGGEDIRVKFENGEWTTASVVGADADTDLAVLQADSMPDDVEGLSVVEENPSRGEEVLVIGTPLDLEQSVTHGIVSGVGRDLRLESGYVIPDIIQTDAPVNPGNSGGPVINSEGEVTGVVTARQGDNIGFAISPEVTRSVVPRLIENGTVKHSLVGIQTVNNDALIAEGNNYSETSGMVVLNVVEGGPSDGALQAPSGEGTITLDNGATVPEGGDVVVAIDGVAVRSGEDLSAYLLKETSPGDTVTMTVLRDGERVDVDVTLGSRSEE